MIRKTNVQRRISQTFKDVLNHQMTCTRVVCEMCQPIIGKKR